METEADDSWLHSQSRVGGTSKIIKIFGKITMQGVQA